MRQKLIRNLPLILPVLALVGIFGYSLWFRELPRADGQITGDFKSAMQQATASGVPLLLVVDHAPY